ncbi:hypothetical protein [Fodinicola acaciae]|uniref:hypothetical protein n=1 Tax=Fodinicola acaciae TaxID=2681555 RepID=UPI0013CFD667|nr:hypothetical protein [Fodinicola acaciae]
MPVVVVPIGFESGPRYQAGVQHHEVILPGGYAKLPPDVWKVWTVAFADLESAASLSLSLDRLIDAATKLGIPSASEHAKALIDDHLLTELDTDKPTEFLQGHRLFPLADGFGAIENERGIYQIAREGRVMIRANQPVYATWCIAAYHDSLWDAVVAYADEIGVAPDEVAVPVAQALPLIVANRCGFLQMS